MKLRVAVSRLLLKCALTKCRIEQTVAGNYGIYLILHAKRGGKESWRTKTMISLTISRCS